MAGAGRAKRRGIAPLFESLPRRIAALPGVISASASLVGPLEGTYADAAGPASPNLVAPGFFETAGMRLLAGRDFNERDTEASARVGIVNQAMARDLFGEENPAGKHFAFRRTDVDIVGVVSDSKFNTVRDSNRRMFYIPYRQDSAHLFALCVLVRTALPPAALAARIRQEIRSADRSLPVVKIDPVEDQINQSLLQERLIAALSSLFGMLAVALTCIGLYGVMSYTTAGGPANWEFVSRWAPCAATSWDLSDRRCHRRHDRRCAIGGTCPGCARVRHPASGCVTP